MVSDAPCIEMKHHLGSSSLFLLTWSSRRTVCSDTLPLGGNDLNSSRREMVWSLLVNWERHQVGSWRTLLELYPQPKRRDSMGHSLPPQYLTLQARPAAMDCLALFSHLVLPTLVSLPCLLLPFLCTCSPWIPPLWPLDFSRPPPGDAPGAFVPWLRGTSSGV